MGTSCSGRKSPAMGHHVGDPPWARGSCPPVAAMGRLCHYLSPLCHASVPSCPLMGGDGGWTLQGGDARGLLAPVSPARWAAHRAGCPFGTRVPMGLCPPCLRWLWDQGKAERFGVWRHCSPNHPEPGAKRVLACGGPGCGTAWGCGAGPRFGGTVVGFWGAPGWRGKAAGRAVAGWRPCGTAAGRSWREPA